MDVDDLTAICECRAPVTAEMAIRFAQAFGSTAEMWLRMQAAHNLGRAQGQANGPGAARSLAIG